MKVPTYEVVWYLIIKKKIRKMNIQKKKMDFRPLQPNNISLIEKSMNLYI